MLYLFHSSVHGSQNMLDNKLTVPAVILDKKKEYVTNHKYETLSILHWGWKKNSSLHCYNISTDLLYCILLCPQVFFLNQEFVAYTIGLCTILAYAKALSKGTFFP